MSARDETVLALLPLFYQQQHHWANMGKFIG